MRTDGLGRVRAEPVGDGSRGLLHRSRRRGVVGVGVGDQQVGDALALHGS